VTAALALWAALGLAHAPPPFRPGPPALVVLIAIDQMRADYFDRFGSQFTGGLARLRSGTFFRHGRQDHAMTETAPGHSTMLSGRDPARTGIVSNTLGVADPLAPVIGAPGELGASPRRFIGSTLYDWMLAADSDARVLSVSRKDRGAIFPVGRARGAVFWYAAGCFTTSRYYADTLPTWVLAYNAKGGPASLAGAVWRPLLPDSAYPEPDSMAYENGGSNVAFPHALPTQPDSAAARLAAFPWMDSLTLDFAVAGMRSMGLGRRERPDLLVVSLSTTDAIGHAFGPDSREIHDHLLHVDRWLGAFLDSLSAAVDGREVVVVLTSDHGVTSFPEYLAGVRHQKAGRVSIADVARLAGQRLAARYRMDFGVGVDNGLLSADVPALKRRGVNVDSLATALAASVRQRPGVADVFTPAALARASGQSVTAGRWRRLLPAGYGWLVAVSLKPGYVWSDGKLSAEHGGMGDDDVEVPIAFMGPGIPRATVLRPVRTVDIGPTLAAYLNVAPTEPVDGRVLREVLPGSLATPPRPRPSIQAAGPRTR